MELRIIQHSNLESNRHWLEAFRANIYTPAFPDPNEREAFEAIVGRLSRGALIAACPATYIVLALDKEQVVGGAVYDWYPRCKAMELIYIAVDPNRRQHGIGRSLILDGTTRLRQRLAEEGATLKQLYFETNDPSRGDLLDSMDAADRVRYFVAMGAKLVHIDYVQPPLSADKAAVDHLMLAVLPQFSDNTEHIAASDLKAFLCDFYRGLDAEHSPFLQRMLDQIDIKAGRRGQIALEEFAEKSRYRFSDICLTLHYAVETSSEGWREDAKRCSCFYSYETDLFNYRCQANRPFSTHLTATVTDAVLYLPKAYCYTSENNTYYRITEADRVALPCDVSMAYSFDPAAQIRVAHLTLAPAEGQSWSELDVIKLVSLFGSRQEQVRYDAEIRLQEQGSEPQGLVDFLRQRLGEGRYTPLRVGITEVELSGITAADGALQVDIEAFIEAFRPNNYTKLEGAMKHVASMLCGITLGIFDFERMHSPEIYDTIQPIVWRDNSFMNLCRGHLLKLEYDPESEEMEATDEAMISPYMLIPSVVMAFNELLLNRADRLITVATEPQVGIAQLSDYIEQIKQILHSDYLVNIFQYASEREIIQTGTIQRGLSARHESLKRRVEILEGRLRELKSLRNNRIDTLQGVLLAVIALMEVRGVFDTYFGAYAEWVFCSVVATVLIGGAWFGWVKYRGE